MTIRGKSILSGFLGVRCGGACHRGAVAMLALCAAVLAVQAGASQALAQRIEPLPKELEGVTVEEHLDAQLPLDTQFVNDSGQAITLGQLFDGERPVILSLNYSNCPMLCRVQLNGLVEAVSQWQWTAGQEYKIVSISIDPRETPARANETKQKYLQQYGRPEAGDGWNFLVGDQEAIQRVASTVGFGYRYDKDRDEYIHAAVMVVCTPEGRISRYLYGVNYDPQTLRLSLVEAAEGKIGSTLDQVLLFCFHYDATKGRYGPTARNLMKVGGLLTVLVLGGVLVPYWWRRSQKPANDAADSASAELSDHEPTPASGRSDQPGRFPEN